MRAEHQLRGVEVAHPIELEINDPLHAHVGPRPKVAESSRTQLLRAANTTGGAA
jgi:hypothetical protein